MCPSKMPTTTSHYCHLLFVGEESEAQREVRGLPWCTGWSMRDSHASSVFSFALSPLCFPLPFMFLFIE